MPLRAHVVDRGDEVDRADQRRQAGEVDQEDPRVHAAARQVGVVRQRRVGGPAGLRRLEEDASVEGDAAEQRAARTTARSGAGTPCRARRSSAARSSCRSPPAPARRTGRPSWCRASRPGRCRSRASTSVPSGVRQLEAHDQRLDATEDEEDEGGEQVHDPDPLVVGRGQPRQPAASAARGSRASRPRAAVGRGGRLRCCLCVSASRSRCAARPGPACGGLDARRLLALEEGRVLARAARPAPRRACRRGWSRTARRTGPCRRPPWRS